MPNIIGRQEVCDNLAFADDTAQADLMDPGLTSQALIMFLEELLNCRGGVWQLKKLIVTAVRRDHPTYDGPNGHSGGNAIDFSQNGADDAVLHLVQDAQSCPHALGIGLGDPWQEVARQCGGYSPQSKLFQDNSTDHIHVQVVGY